METRCLRLVLLRAALLLLELLQLLSRAALLRAGGVDRVNKANAAPPIISQRALPWSKFSCWWNIPSEGIILR